jgi:hypothetical protein
VAYLVATVGRFSAILVVDSSLERSVASVNPAASKTQSPLPLDATTHETGDSMRLSNKVSYKMYY